MKHFKTVIVLMLSVLVIEGSAKKVFILHEQIDSTTVSVTEVITQQTEEIPEVTEAIVGMTETADGVTQEISEVTEEIITLADVSLLAGEPDKISEDNNIEIVLQAGAIDDEKSTNECLLEGITSFADQNIRDECALYFLKKTDHIPCTGLITLCMWFHPKESLMELANSEYDIYELAEAFYADFSHESLFYQFQDLLRRLCTISGSALSALYIVTVQNTTVKSDLSLATLCADGPKGLLTWISWQDFNEKVKPLLNVEELPQLVVRNSSIGVPTESENEFDPFSEVLIEMLPLSYKLLDVKQSAWNNITFIKEISLGSTELVNLNKTDAHVEGSIAYSFPVQTNITFLSNYPINELPVEMSDETQNFIVGSSNKYTFNSTFLLERLVPSFKTESVSLNGTWGITEYDIEGTIVSFFGVNADGTAVEVVTLGASKIKESNRLEDNIATSTEDIELTANEELPVAIPIIRESDVVYPGFKKVFYVTCVLFFGTVLIAMTDIVRKLLRDRQERLRGRRAYQKVTPSI